VSKETLDHKVSRVIQAQSDLVAHQVLQVNQERMVLMEKPASKDLVVIVALRVCVVLRAHQVHKD